MASTVPLDTIYTAEEAAARLRLTNRGVIKLGKEHGVCSRSGRNYLFSERDLLALWQILREPPKVPMLTTVKARASDLRLYEALQKLTAKRKGRPGRSKWEATNAKNKELREATKAAVEKWKDDEPLDHSNRDPAYWTHERKERRRLESLAKKRGWMART
ncbi:hypothetical protein [Sinorhizobium meliloti]|uniref:hypothetical protein n=1 Tax=Rhizobium meliloti TaxID=382 RepID=UPI000FD94FEA|nr:hypothetical protein [Sinorhizobium meliloti]RVH50669.1 hypothetical protein CN212_10375 [Sinorhizobium meliloti]